MDWDLENENLKLESMIIIYQEENERLEKENQKLKSEVVFLTQQLEFKTMGLPDYDEEPRDNSSGR
tara:strand:- start:4181 stop:4378 length:198 start_codon:yes stop_codon:yes gene_type:complete